MDMSNIIVNVTINGVSVTPYVDELQLKSGRSQVGQNMETGTCFISLDNGVGNFNGSAYPKTGQVIVIYGKDNVELFTGNVESVQTARVDGVAQIRVSGVDKLARLGRQTIADYSLNAQQPLYDWPLSEAGTTYANTGRAALRTASIKRAGTSGTYVNSVGAVGLLKGIRLTGSVPISTWYSSGYYIDALPATAATEKPITATTDWSFGGWIQPQAADGITGSLLNYGGNQPIIRVWTDSAAQKIVFSNLYDLPDDNSIVTMNYDFPCPEVFDGGWHHIVFTYEAATGNISFFIDGFIRWASNLIVTGWAKVPVSKSGVLLGGTVLFNGDSYQLFRGGMASWFIDNSMWSQESVYNRYVNEAHSGGESALYRAGRLGADYFNANDFTLAGAEYDPEATVLDELRRLASAVNGVVFVDGQGKVVVTAHNYNGAYSEGTLPFEIEADASLEVSDDGIKNSVTITKVDGALITATDDASIAAYGLRRSEISVGLQRDIDALASAEWNVYEFGNPTVVAEMSIDFTSLPNTSTFTPASFRLFHTYTVPALNNAEYRIEGIDLHVTRDSAVGHYSLYEASKFNGYVQLNSTTFGQLGINKLAF